MTDLSQDKCLHYKECSGCSLWDIPYEQQLNQKIKSFEKIVHENDLFVRAPIYINGLENIEYRNRFDFTFYKGNIGLYSKVERNEIVDISECKILDPNLKLFFKRVKSIILKYQQIFLDSKLSFRIRNNRNEKFGIWIDTSNELIKKLLAQREFFVDLMAISILEVGQKNKRVTDVDGQLKLSKIPILENWFDTRSFDSKKMPLYLSVGGFTQPSVALNEILIKTCEEILGSESFSSISEFFSGMGNFTLYLLSKGLPLKSYEISGEASEALALALKNFPNLQKLISFEKINLYGNGLKLSFHKDELLFVDPPRSGLGKMIEVLESNHKDHLPKSILYVSCFEGSLIEDLKRLQVLGFEIQKCVGVDQFAFSDHVEWITYLKYKD